MDRSMLGGNETIPTTCHQLTKFTTFCQTTRSNHGMNESGDPGRERIVKSPTQVTRRQLIGTLFAWMVILIQLRIVFSGKEFE